MQVITVTSTELGWDCVVGVWEHTAQNLKELLRKYSDDSVYVVQVRTLDTKVEIEE